MLLYQILIRSQSDEVEDLPAGGTLEPELSYVVERIPDTHSDADQVNNVKQSFLSIISK